MRNRNRNLYDLLLDETAPWESLDEEHKNLALRILARLMAQAVLHDPERRTNDE